METILKETFARTISVSGSLENDPIVTPQAQGTFFITLKPDAKALKLNITMQEESHLQLFIYNQAESAADVDIRIEMQKDAVCRMGLLDLQNAPLHWNQLVELQNEGADFEILSGQLCMADQKKTGDLEVRHTAGHTHGEIRNFAVLLDRGNYEMVANGNIEKNCPEAQSHQATRVLTLGEDHTAKVIPLLLIDENEVKASHALTIGQPDEEQLYYLQSRGLTTKQAIGLLSVGYFLPVLDMIEDQDLHDRIRAEMESKVGLNGRTSDTE
ncbi:MAG: SufD family Fe-S cluster assembly protein [Catenisphaera adipataccumulans]|jgi:Fe-S cluster assembly protein SufD|uniref:SufD family Fe-S cluster assembly protein n=1 Tax=Catenisphaera adipataccumulans TaxID=700500 RepID=UPI003D8EC162